MRLRVPPRSHVGKEVENNGRAATTRTDERSEPSVRALADEIDLARQEIVWLLIHQHGMEERFRSRLLLARNNYGRLSALSEEGGQPRGKDAKTAQDGLHGEGWLSLKRGISRSGFTSARPTCRPNDSQDTPSPSGS